MKAILQEVQNELLSGRLLEPKYYGVVFAHKDDHAAIFDILKTAINGSLHIDQGKFVTKSGAVLRVIDEGGNTDSQWRGHHCGALYTTIIISNSMLLDEKMYFRVQDPHKFKNYMQSRLRTECDLHTRMVIC